MIAALQQQPCLSFSTRTRSGQLIQQESYLIHSYSPLYRGCNELRAAAIGYAERDDRRSRSERWLSDVERFRRGCQDALEYGDYGTVFRNIQEMTTLLEETNLEHAAKQTTIEVVDSVVESLTREAFAAPFSARDYDRVQSGVKALNLQLSSKSLRSRTVPRYVLASALQAVSQVVVANRFDISQADQTDFLDSSFRIVQRLFTGAGIRGGRQKLRIHQKEIATALNLYCEVGRMDFVAKVVALQERTQHAPPLSGVVFSILFKGYGRLCDIQRVEKTLEKARELRIEPDTILFNSIADAYVNCGDVERAEALFKHMCNPEAKQVFPSFKNPQPNSRTYNILLKGLANRGLLRDALGLSAQMKKKLLWTNVTTNILVHAAVVAQDLSAADEILRDHTSPNNRRIARHPNVEAYTELLDAYGKSGEHEKAIGVMSLMRQRNVEPNEYTYSCVLASLGRQGETEKAKSTLAYMKQNYIPVRAVSYNSLISGLLDSQGDAEQHLARIKESIGLIGDMTRKKVFVNDITVSTVVEAMSKCNPPLVLEAHSLVDKLEAEGVVERTARVSTALIKACGAAGDLSRAVSEFRNITSPDVAAVNAFLTVCCRLNRSALAKETFNRYFQSKWLRPDLISFSVIVGHLVSLSKSQSRAQGILLYSKMKKLGIFPDNGMIDSVLKPLLRHAPYGQLTDQEVKFVVLLLRDAEKLSWQSGQLERRKRAIRSVLGDRLKGFIGKGADSLFSERDELLQKHGWNEVDSGFRLWDGAPRFVLSDSDPKEDEFLESKGWNDVDSGFRFF